jgi:hypothetical protein
VHSFRGWLHSQDANVAIKLDSSLEVAYFRKVRKELPSLPRARARTPRA